MGAITKAAAWQNGEVGYLAWEAEHRPVEK